MAQGNITLLCKSYSHKSSSEHRQIDRHVLESELFNAGALLEFVSFGLIRTATTELPYLA